MANTVTITTLLDGPRHVILHVYLKSDGVSGELSDELMVDPSLLSPVSENKPAKFLTLEDCTWGFNGFSANLYFELLVDDTLIWVLPPSSGNYADFKKYGGLKDRSDKISVGDGTGKLFMSTTGFVDDGDEGSLIIKLKKDAKG